MYSKKTSALFACFFAFMASAGAMEQTQQVADTNLSSLHQSVAETPEGDVGTRSTQAQMPLSSDAGKQEDPILQRKSLLNLQPVEEDKEIAHPQETPVASNPQFSNTSQPYGQQFVHQGQPTMSQPVPQQQYLTTPYGTPQGQQGFWPQGYQPPVFQNTINLQNSVSSPDTSTPPQSPIRRPAEIYNTVQQRPKTAMVPKKDIHTNAENLATALRSAMYLNSMDVPAKLLSWTTYLTRGIANAVTNVCSKGTPFYQLPKDDKERSACALIEVVECIQKNQKRERKSKMEESWFFPMGKPTKKTPTALGYKVPTKDQDLSHNVFLYTTSIPKVDPAFDTLKEKVRGFKEKLRAKEMQIFSSSGVLQYVLNAIASYPFAHMVLVGDNNKAPMKVPANINSVDTLKELALLGFEFTSQDSQRTFETLGNVSSNLSSLILQSSSGENIPGFNGDWKNLRNVYLEGFSLWTIENIRALFVLLSRPITHLYVANMGTMLVSGDQKNFRTVLKEVKNSTFRLETLGGLEGVECKTDALVDLVCLMPNLKSIDGKWNLEKAIKILQSKKQVLKNNNVLVEVNADYSNTLFKEGLAFEGDPSTNLDLLRQYAYETLYISAALEGDEVRRDRAKTLFGAISTLQNFYLNGAHYTRADVFK